MRERGVGKLRKRERKIHKKCVNRKKKENGMEENEGKRTVLE